LTVTYAKLPQGFTTSATTDTAADPAVTTTKPATDAVETVPLSAALSSPSKRVNRSAPTPFAKTAAAKTVPCKYIQTQAGCKKGNRCPFDHSFAAVLETAIPDAEWFQSEVDYWKRRALDTEQQLISTSQTLINMEARLGHVEQMLHDTDRMLYHADQRVFELEKRLKEVSKDKKRPEPASVWEKKSNAYKLQLGRVEAKCAEYKKTIAAIESAQRKLAALPRPAQTLTSYSDKQRMLICEGTKKDAESGSSSRCESIARLFDGKRWVCNECGWCPRCGFA